MMRFFLVGLLALAACGGQSPETSAPETHSLTGRVVEVHPALGRVTVDHEEIPGVMDAMTMSFTVERDVLEKLKPGDRIRATLVTSEEGFHLRQVALVGNGS